MVGGWFVKRAMIDLFPSIVITKGLACPLASPDHPVNWLKPCVTAVSVTLVSGA